MSRLRSSLPSGSCASVLGLAVAVLVACEEPAPPEHEWLGAAAPYILSSGAELVAECPLSPETVESVPLRPTWIDEQTWSIQLSGTLVAARIYQVDPATAYLIEPTPYQFEGLASMTVLAFEDAAAPPALAWDEGISFGIANMPTSLAPTLEVYDAQQQAYSASELLDTYKAALADECAASSVAQVLNPEGPMSWDSPILRLVDGEYCSDAADPDGERAFSGCVTEAELDAVAAENALARVDFDD